MKHLNETHGEASGSRRTKEYRAWRSIKQRCYLETNKDFHNYGARGIEMCPEWIGSFERFLFDMGRAPTALHSIDRINNSGNYTKENCRWSQPKPQARNRRTNVFVEHNGKTQCVLDWSLEIGIPRWSISRRLEDGWSMQKIIDHYGFNYQKQKYTKQCLL